MRVVVVILHKAAHHHHHLIILYLVRCVNPVGDDVHWTWSELIRSLRKRLTFSLLWGSGIKRSSLMATRIDLLKDMGEKEGGGWW